VELDERLAQVVKGHTSAYCPALLLLRCIEWLILIWSFHLGGSVENEFFRKEILYEFLTFALFP